MKPKINLLAITLAVVAVFTTAFAFVNYGRVVSVWPFGSHSLTLVIAVAFALGLAVGALVGKIASVLRGGSPRLHEGEFKRGEQRAHPGRP